MNQTFMNNGTSRIWNGKNARYVKHSILTTENDAYFDPSGKLNLRFVLDGRIYEVEFCEENSNRLAKRLCLDTLDRALKAASRIKEKLNFADSPGGRFREKVLAAYAVFKKESQDL